MGVALYSIIKSPTGNIQIAIVKLSLAHTVAYACAPVFVRAPSLYNMCILELYLR